MKKLKKDRSKMLIEVMPTWVLKDHFTGIRFKWEKGRFEKNIVGFKVCGDVYDLKDYGRFLFCAAFLGVAVAKIQQEKIVKVAVPLVWGLRDYLVSIEKEGRQSDSEFTIMCIELIKKAFKLIGFDVDVTFKERRFIIGDKITGIVGGGNDGNGNGHVAFDTLGIPSKVFFCSLGLGLYWGNLT